MTYVPLAISSPPKYNKVKRLSSTQYSRRRSETLNSHPLRVIHLEPAKWDSAHWTVGIPTGEGRGVSSGRRFRWRLFLVNLPLALRLYRYEEYRLYLSPSPQPFCLVAKLIPWQEVWKALSRVASIKILLFSAVWLLAHNLELLWVRPARSQLAWRNRNCGKDFPLH